MIIQYFGYNTFLISNENYKIVIDPGASLYFFRFPSLLPKQEWKDITHIFVTHGDPDHYWYIDKVANASGAKVICNRNLIRNIDGKELLLGPRSKGLAFNTVVNNVHPISFDEVIEIDGIKITGIHSFHGPIIFKIGPFEKKFEQGPDERLGFGSIGYMIEIDEKVIINLGDTLLLDNVWNINQVPDVLMVPIGGKIPKNTMDENEALKAVEIINPKIVIPCHYNGSDFFRKLYNVADDKWFKTEVEKTGKKCFLLSNGDSINI